MASVTGGWWIWPGAQNEGENMSWTAAREGRDG